MTFNLVGFARNPRKVAASAASTGFSRGRSPKQKDYLSETSAKHFVQITQEAGKTGFEEAHRKRACIVKIRFILQKVKYTVEYI